MKHQDPFQSVSLAKPRATLSAASPQPLTASGLSAVIVDAPSHGALQYVTVRVQSKLNFSTSGVVEWPDTPRENRRRDFWRNVKNETAANIARPKKLHWHGSKCRHVSNDTFTFDRILEGDDFLIATEELPTAVCVTCLEHFNEA